MEVEILPKDFKLEENKCSPETSESVKLDLTIKQIIEKEGFIKYNIDKRCVSTNGGNYLGTLYEIDVKGSTKDGSKEINIFVKYTIDLGSFQVISVSKAYDAEIFVYKELSKIFETLQENANVPVEERYKMVKVYDESNTEAIIMENIVKKGFTTQYRMDTMSLQFVEKCIKYIAKFHALSFVLREKMPKYFNDKIKPNKHLYIFDDDWYEVVKKMRDILMEHTDEETKVKVEKLFKDLGYKYYRNLTDESIKVCLCHGDYRANNIMIKMNEGEVEDIMPVDYQLMHYGSPVLDIMHLIYTGTDREFRKAHMSNVKDLYYETLTNFLKYFDLDSGTVFSREEFERVFKERFDHGLMIGLLSIPFIFAVDEQTIDMSKQKSDVKAKLDERFKDRLRGFIEEYEELGYI